MNKIKNALLVLKALGTFIQWRRERRAIRRGKR